MKVLVTGATGNVGTSVIAALSADAEVQEIVGVARRLPAAPAPAKARWQQADITSTDLVPLFRGVDAVVHLAWLIQPSRDERVTREVNVHGSGRVFDAAVRAGVPALVHASSVGAYAPGPVDTAVAEDWPATGIASSYYSRQKAEVERLLDEAELAAPQMRVVRLRPALCFKGGAATGIRRLFAGPLLPNALLRREWIGLLPYPHGLRTQAVHSDDVAEAYRLAAVRSDVRGAFNVAGEPVLDAATVGRALGARTVQLPASLVRAAATASWRLRLVPVSPDWLDMGMQTPIMDTTRAHEQLGWHPRHGADEALIELIDGLRTGADQPTPPLHREGSGPLRAHEFSSGMGAVDGATKGPGSV
jgi:nucleoside-diphosphate-sugar epimerase